MSSRRFPGFFIALEGIDGCGSTTHVKLLEKALRQRGHQVQPTCEPSNGPIGMLIRQVLQKRLFVPDATGPRAFAWSTMALLFAADRMDHLDSTVVPGLRDGAVVITDRYDLSSLAYQSVTAPGGEKVIPWIRELNAAALRPDLTVVINVPGEVAEQRRKTRGGMQEIFDSNELQEKLVEVYGRAEDLVPGDTLVHVSGVGEVQEVAGRILELVVAADPEFFKPKP